MAGVTAETANFILPPIAKLISRSENPDD